MNKWIDKFARDELKKGLRRCTKGEFGIFKRMYSHDNMDASIEEAVDKMPSEKLDWAMKQVDNTLKKRGA